MKILHYIPIQDKSEAQAARYVDALMEATSNMSQSRVLTQKMLGGNIVSILLAWNRILKEEKPDIVHIHAAWNFYAAMLESYARAKGYLTVVSVHNKLTSDELLTSFWKKKLPRILAYQFKMVRNCKVLVSTSEKEHQELVQLRWKRRVALVAKGEDNNAGKEQMASTAMSAYRKVIDTYYTNYITEEEREFVEKCVFASLWREGAFMMPLEEYKVPEKLSYRRIYIFAHDNDVTEMMVAGATVLGIKLPPRLDMENLPRYKQKRKEKRKETNNCQKLCEIISTCIPEAEAKMKTTPEGKLTLRTIADIYASLRFSNYDESEFCSLLKKKGIEKWTRKLLGLLQEKFNLETGFMPLMPL